MSTSGRIYGAIEAGGTKFVCAVGRSPGEILAETRIATTSPQETLAAASQFLASASARFGDLVALGVASFGPLDLDPASASYGRILATPKSGWAGADLIGPLRERFGRPVGLDTDVNAAAWAELELGAARGLRSVAYVTVGTGIGGGVVAGGRAAPLRQHPEMGHIRVRRHPLDASFAGLCPFHGDCLEGLACGPAIEARWGAPLDALGAEHPAHSIIADYLGQLAATIALVAAPERILIGGGVMTGGALLPAIRRSAANMLGGYAPAARLEPSLEQFIGAPGLGARSGISGALLLAAAA